MAMIALQTGKLGVSIHVSFLNSPKQGDRARFLKQCEFNHTQFFVDRSRCSQIKKATATEIWVDDPICQRKFFSKIVRLRQT